jgi:cyclopropane fatty-acyl-phospholipid synthase-like methyltransferase
MTTSYIRMKAFFEKAYLSTRTPWPATQPTASIERFARKLRDVGRTGRVLDLGCGEGRHTFLFAGAGFETYGLDYLPLAIEKAQERARTRDVKTGYTFIVGDALLPPFRPQSFDVLVDSGLFHHVKQSDWGAYCQHVTTLLKDSGHLLLTVFSSRCQYYPGKERLRNWSLHEGCYDHFFQESDFQRIFGCWFDILELAEEHFGPRAFWNILMQKRARLRGVPLQTLSGGI